MIGRLLGWLFPLRETPYRQKVAAWGDAVPRYRVTQPAASQRQWRVVERWRKQA